MEFLLSIWIENEVVQRIPLSRMVIQSKANNLFDDIKSKAVSNDNAHGSNTDKNEAFEASQGWFERFEVRANLHSIALKGEAASANITAAELYPTELKALIQEGVYGPKQLYTLHPDQLNNTKKAELEIIFFNRLEKVGSQSMSVLLNMLSKKNNFVPYRNAPAKHNEILTDVETQREIVEELIGENEPLSYVEHLNWINFTEFGQPKPIYINLVRHPIEKVISAYYYIRHPAVFAFYVQNGLKMEEKEYFDTSFNDCIRKKRKECIYDSHSSYNADWRRFAMHFCGNLEICVKFNSQTATQIAKRNIETEYAVVGSWEDTNITLTVLEHYIPRFFKGATKVFYSDPKRFHRNATPHKNELDPDIEEKLKVQFSFEIELYNFCKQRLYKQYIAIKKDEVTSQFN
ncbi:heparan sulfate 2-O-sulfotransferase pipe-like [Anastrepha ludens]|uniref:heparan sulfate 2-O-sulfotransferase pipe-like n=1 Tax=Anastrepha ludens TaxID=28586 RepID=UPI0023B16A4E|nr:heparan sulfate 2-O-sulfotransferase pipe-like [Anastrepha ludens]